MDIYGRIQILRKELLNATLGLEKKDLWASQCPSCFGPKKSDEVSSLDGTDAIIAMDGNFQHRHHHFASTDVPSESDYPSIFITPSQINAHENQIQSTNEEAAGVQKFGLLYDIGCHLDAHVKKQAIDSMEECQVKLQEIYGRFNHFSDECYTSQFFEAQWIAERSYYGNRDHVKEEQKIELGKLLALEQDLIEEWEEIRSPEESLACVRSMREIQLKIEQQRQRIGANELLAGLTPESESLFLKVWWAKTNLRQKFLALLEEKRPLDAVRKGVASKLGTDGKERLIIAIRKRTAALQAVLNTYNRHLDAFHLAFPQLTTLKKIEYDELMSLDADSSFWSDGVFTNKEEPWAVDADTQDGMRLLARLTRCEEEVRRIGQEIRRAARWAITEHNRIIPLMFGLTSEMDWANARLQPVMNHSILQTLSSDDDQLDAIKAILHNHFIELSSLQLHWNTKLVSLVSASGPYENDNELINDWNEQLVRLTFLKASGHLSVVAGDFNNAIGNALDNVDEAALQNFLTQDFNGGAAPTNSQDGQHDEDENNELLAPNADQFELALEQEALTNALANEI
ncbi:hypothetical protein PtA15_11A307 [Puccinia triticina]|uniref:Dynein heavy chain linker domain-containing protein n=1 Tax=Puccinia triticina TaxID=208348 RepID=A0ABY7CYW6_9BASI|nr:uncharacterized protein PtA15_11A307 [Puccinia triticina]WAQ89617.1 hypothetical protein PtA15_11A307 [Puccinia triticina]